MQSDLIERLESDLARGRDDLTALRDKVGAKYYFFWILNEDDFDPISACQAVYRFDRSSLVLISFVVRTQGAQVQSRVHQAEDRVLDAGLRAKGRRVD
jgi:hypothetical protein